MVFFFIILVFPYNFSAYNWGPLCLLHHICGGFKCHVWVQGLDLRLWMFWVKAQSLLLEYCVWEELLVLARYKAKISISVRHRMVYYVSGLFDFSSSGVRVRLHLKWVSVSTTDLDYALCHFLLISSCCSLIAACQGVCHITSRHAGNFVYSGRVKFNPLPLNVCRPYAECIHACTVWESGVDGEIFNCFFLW